MSTEKKTPPILASPAKPFTLRLVDGHFVRVPRLENLPATDATRPPATTPQEAFPCGDGGMLRRGLQLVNGRFVNGPGSAPVQIPPNPAAPDAPPAAMHRAEAPAAPSPDSWAYAFGTKLDPSDSPPET